MRVWCGVCSTLLYRFEVLLGQQGDYDFNLYRNAQDKALRRHHLDLDVYLSRVHGLLLTLCHLLTYSHPQPLAGPITFPANVRGTQTDLCVCVRVCACVGGLVAALVCLTCVCVCVCVCSDAVSLLVSEAPAAQLCAGLPSQGGTAAAGRPAQRGQSVASERERFCDVIPLVSLSLSLCVCVLCCVKVSDFKPSVESRSPGLFHPKPHIWAECDTLYPNYSWSAHTHTHTHTQTERESLFPASICVISACRSEMQTVEEKLVELLEKNKVSPRPTSIHPSIHQITDVSVCVACVRHQGGSDGLSLEACLPPRRAMPTLLPPFEEAFCAWATSKPLQALGLMLGFSLVFDVVEDESKRLDTRSTQLILHLILRLLVHGRERNAIIT